jgi:hypothetical protein
MRGLSISRAHPASEDSAQNAALTLRDKSIEDNVETYGIQPIGCCEMHWTQNIRQSSGSSIKRYSHPFSEEDWDHLQLINRILAEFQDFTFIVSKRQPQINLSIPRFL